MKTPEQSMWLEYESETPPQSVVQGYEAQENECVATLLNGIPDEGGSAPKRTFEMLIRMAFQGGLVAIQSAGKGKLQAADKQAKEDKEYIEDLCAQLCKMEDALGFKNDYTDKDGAFVPTIGPWLERVRDLIASEGELGDVKDRLQAVERDNGLLKEQIRVADVAYQSLHERHQAVERERDEYSTALAMICSQPPKYAKPIAEAALKVSEAEVAQFMKEYDEGKHPLSAEDEAALERSREKLMQRIRKALQPAQKDEPEKGTK